MAKKSKPAKRVEEVEQPEVETPAVGGEMADLLRMQIESSGASLPGMVTTNERADIEQVLFGVPIPYLSLRYFFTSNVFPVRKTILIAGEPGCGKTSMMLDFQRMVIQYALDVYKAAFGYVIHTENKWPDQLPPSILRDLSKHLRVNVDIDDLQDWMRLATEFLNGQKKRANEAADKSATKWPGAAKAPLNRLPIPLGVDSIGGAQGADRTKKMKQEGAPTRDFSEIARVLTEWMPPFTQWMADSSVIAFFILHLKEDSDGWYTPGGVAKDFFSSYTVYTYNPKKEIDPVLKNGSIQTWLKLHKDSYGPGGVQIPALMRWEFKDNQQITTWDWHYSTVYLISGWLGTNSLVKQDLQVNKKHPLRDALSGWKVQSGGTKGLLYSCDRIRDGDRGLPYNEFAQAIEADEKFRTELDQVFNIPQRITVAEYFRRQDAMAQAKEDAKRKGGRKVTATVPPPSAPVVATAEDSSGLKGMAGVPSAPADAVGDIEV